MQHVESFRDLIVFVMAHASTSCTDYRLRITDHLSSYIVFCIVIASLVTLPVRAAGPRSWESATQEDLLKGRLRNVSLSSDGKLFLAPQFQTVYEIGPGFLFALSVDSASNFYLGTGSDGKVYKVDPKGNGSLFYKAPDPNVFSLACDAQGNLFVGSSPDGKVYKVLPNGQAVEFFDPRDKYIWAMAFDKPGNLWVTTGGKGLLYKVDKTGKGEQIYDSDEAHLISLTLDLEGNLIAGSAPNGLVYRITPGGKASVLLDSSLTEIRQVAVDRVGTIYAVALSASSQDLAISKKEGDSRPPLSKPPIGSQSPEPSSPAESTTTVIVSAGLAVGPPSASPTGKGEKTILYRLNKDGSTEKIWASPTDMVYDIQIRDDGKVLAATGTRGRILAIDPGKSYTILTESGEEQLVRFCMAGTVLYAASSNKAALHKLVSARATTGSYESDILDAGLSSAWGQIWWTVVNPSGVTIELFTRCGNTAEYNKTWSDWSGPYSAKDGEKIKHPISRYIQWKAEFKSGGGDKGLLSQENALQGVTLAYEQKNVRPVIGSLNVLPPGLLLQRLPMVITADMGGSAGPATEDALAILDGLLSGKTKSYIMPPRRQVRLGSRSFTWQAGDENKDNLLYHLHFRAENETEWKPLEKDLEDDFYSMESRRLPDGLYRLRLTADDSSDNPFQEGLSSEMISKPFLVDNTPPLIEVQRGEAKGKAITIAFRAKDAGNRIYRSEYSIDGGPWRILLPVDGIADSAMEDFLLQTGDQSSGEHLIGLRTADTFGNVGTARITISIP